MIKLLFTMILVLASSIVYGEEPAENARLSCSIKERIYYPNSFAKSTFKQIATETKEIAGNYAHLVVSLPAPYEKIEFRFFRQDMAKGIPTLSSYFKAPGIPHNKPYPSEAALNFFGARTGLSLYFNDSVTLGQKDGAYISLLSYCTYTFL